MTQRSLPTRLMRPVLAAVAAGVVLAALAVPGAAVASWAVGHAGASYDNLPQALRTPASAQASYLYAADGKTLVTTFYDENRKDVTLGEIADSAEQAVVAAEDVRFYQHNGVDLKGVLRAVVANSGSGDVEQGASTLTMQYVRNVLKGDASLTEAERAEATKVTPARKIREARYALAIEQRLSKAEILNRYLNIAYFGAGSYGIYAASHTYFSKDPAGLTLAESALLAGLLQSPEADNPIDGDAEHALARRSYVLASMTGTGAITAAQAAQAGAEKLALRRGTIPNDCVAAAKSYGFFCDYVRQWWRAQPAFGENVAQREQALRQGGYRIVTTLDPKVQAAAQAQSTGVYGYGSDRVLPTAVVQPGTGHVLAMAVNRHYSLDKGAANTVNQLIAGGGSVNGYQAGSTFKMFTMLAALESGMTLDTGFSSPGKLKTGWADGGEGNCDGYWCPVNATPSWMNGYRTMWTGFGRSVNTYFVRLEEQVGSDKAIEMAQRLGVSFRASDDADRAANEASSWGAFTLGVSATTPLDLANAYATLAADGKYCTPLPVGAVTDAGGQAVAVGEPACTQAVTPDVARAATDAARCPVGQSGAFYRCDGATAPGVSDLLDGRPVAGKTGSSTDNRTESFVAITPQLAAAAIAANPDNPSDAVGSAVLSKVYRAVGKTLAASLKGQPEEDFGTPSEEIAFQQDSSSQRWSGGDLGSDPDGEPSSEPSSEPSGEPSSGPGDGSGMADQSGSADNRRPRRH